ncbi:restriction endonuclease subunit S [Vibrio aestuarianus]|uniref:restriction endonuclease subunit S n=1 Tax=Vibrio aestuarianus TaxID=28171 RepID=UPI004068E47F
MSWPLVALKDCCTVVGGATPKREVESYWDSQDIPWVTPKDISKIKSIYLDDAPEYISQKGFDSCAAHKLPEGSLLLTSRAPIGNVAITTRELCTNQGFKSLVPSESVDIKYLYFCMLYSAERLENEGNGATFKEVSKKVVEAFKIPLPPLETQKQIAEVLEKADQLRKDCQQMEQELNSLAQSVFIDMFGDPLTNPKGWEVRKLKEFYISEKDGTKCGPFGSALKKEEFVESGVPVWNMDNIALNGTFRDGASLWITKQKYEELDKYSVNQGDVIISRAGTVGKMGVVKSIYEQSIISTNLIRVRFGDKLDPLYFVCLMTYFKTRLKRLKVGDDGSFSHMNTGILDQLEFPYPPVEEQQKYIQFRSKLDDEIERLTSLKNEQECNFNSLMQKAFKGELNL